MAIFDTYKWNSWGADQRSAWTNMALDESFSGAFADPSAEFKKRVEEISGLDSVTFFTQHSWVYERFKKKRDSYSIVNKALNASSSNSSNTENDQESSFMGYPKNTIAFGVVVVGVLLMLFAVSAKP
ncbi:MAG: hypothetical protein Q7J34_04035 [Bacteroidales bacterium]|nr:hypothetical protein [Bacteroidales bacterium]